MRPPPVLVPRELRGGRDQAPVSATAHLAGTGHEHPRTAALAASDMKTQHHQSEDP